ncbi:hypothetical protein [Gimesia sp.]|uniref:hypothetical protein n=1 Tax=Gimesia sp. TaxID=2024833 RepID=UPI003A90CBCE
MTGTSQSRVKAETGFRRSSVLVTLRALLFDKRSNTFYAPWFEPAPAIDFALSESCAS